MRRKLKKLSVSKTLKGPAKDSKFYRDFDEKKKPVELANKNNRNRRIIRKLHAEEVLNETQALPT